MLNVLLSVLGQPHGKLLIVVIFQALVNDLEPNQPTKRAQNIMQYLTSFLRQMNLSRRSSGKYSLVGSRLPHGDGLWRLFRVVRNTIGEAIAHLACE
jgi:hypothetical protein